MAIFIALSGDLIKVTGDTLSISQTLGIQGLKFKYNKDKKLWRGPSSLKALETLQSQSGAIMSSDAAEEMTRFQKAAEKRAAYMRAR